MGAAAIIGLYLLAMPIALVFLVTSVATDQGVEPSDFTTANHTWIITMTVFWPVLSFIVLLTAAIQSRRRSKGERS